MKYHSGTILLAGSYLGDSERSTMIEEAKAYCEREGYDRDTVSIKDNGEQILVRVK